MHQAITLLTHGHSHANLSQGGERLERAMSSRDDVDRVLAVVCDLKHTTKKLEALHELDVKMAIEFFERSPPLEPPSDDTNR